MNGYGESWIDETSVIADCIEDRDGELIAYGEGRDEGFTRGRRIVECVNACAGIPSSLLSAPGYSIKAELDNLDEQISMRLKAEQGRDALLAAAKNAAIDLRGTPDGEALIAAIAKAQH